MIPINDAMARLQEIADRIAQIRQQAQLPPTLRERQAAEATSSSSASGTTAPGATPGAADVSRFQTLLDQAISLSDTGAASSPSGVGADSAPFDLLSQMVESGSTSAVNASSASSSDALLQYQQMLLDAIRQQSGGQG